MNPPDGAVGAVVEFHAHGRVRVDLLDEPGYGYCYLGSGSGRVGIEYDDGVPWAVERSTPRSDTGVRVDE